VNIEEEVDRIKSRNKKVEADKAWETSKTRRFVLMLLTYLTILLFFVIIGVPNPYTNAVVPAFGFFLSTLTLSFFKSLWLRNIYKS